MNETQLLSEANSLVSNGLRKAAIDLLIEYLDSNPHSPVITNAIGKVYLLDRQPEKAVLYLQQSLKLKQLDEESKTEKEYNVDSFHDDDLDFIESESNDFDADLYEFEETLEPFVPVTSPEASQTIDPPVPDLQADDKKLVDKRNILKINPLARKEKSPEPKTNDIKVKFKSKKRKSDEKNNDLINVDIPSKPNSQNKTGISNEQEENESISPTQKEDVVDENLAQKTDKAAVNHIKPPEITEQPDFLDYEENIQIDLFDGSEVDQIEDDEYITGDLFEDPPEEVDDSEDILGNDLDFIDPQDEEVADDLIWDDFDDADEYDELAHRDSEEEIQTGGKLSREQRALQVAIDILEYSGWDNKHSVLLQQIFFENGWSAAKTAVKNLIDRGVTPEELYLARKIKRFWMGNERYWTTFHRIKNNACSKQAHDGYKNMSWPESIRIINCFPSLPDIEEIYKLIDDTFEFWYSNQRLRNSFKAFLKFLKYRTGSMNRTLSGDYEYFFIESPDMDTGVDSDNLNITGSVQSYELSEMGINLYGWSDQDNNIMIKTDGDE